jgi:hypothetical protein
MRACGLFEILQRSSAMNRQLWTHGVALGLLILVAGGCGIPGTWRSVSLEPEVARNEFLLFRSAAIPEHEFTRATIMISDDATYSAEVYYGQHLHRSTGTWEKTDDETLTFVDSKGAAFTYETELSRDHKELTLTKRVEGSNVKLVLRRQS